MQLNVQIRPSYEDSFERAYPAVARRLRSADETVLKYGSSPYEIVEKWDALLAEIRDQRFKDLLLRYKGRLQGLHKKIEDEIVDWHLGEADRMLYIMEDIFEEIDRETTGL
jgi:hypothetical protein